MKHVFTFLALMLTAQPVWADAAWTWFALKPDSFAPGAEVEAPFEGMFYVRAATYEAAANLIDPYNENPKDESLNVLAAGTALFLVHTRSSQYYCSTIKLAKDLSVTQPGSVLLSAVRASLLPPFMNMTILPRQQSWQCFEDADGDTRFETVAGGERVLAGFPAVKKVGGDDSIKQPVQYGKTDPSALPVVMELGLAGSVLDKEREQYQISLCTRALSPDTLLCDKTAKWVFDGRSSKPLDVPFLDGVISVVAITANDVGQLHIHFVMKRPAEAILILQEARLLYPNDIQYGLRYQTPAKKN